MERGNYSLQFVLRTEEGDISKQFGHPYKLSHGNKTEQKSFDVSMLALYKREREDATLIGYRKQL